MTSQRNLRSSRSASGEVSNSSPISWSERFLGLPARHSTLSRLLRAEQRVASFLPLRSSMTRPPFSAPSSAARPSERPVVARIACHGRRRSPLTLFNCVKPPPIVRQYFAGQNLRVRTNSGVVVRGKLIGVDVTLGEAGLQRDHLHRRRCHLGE